METRFKLLQLIEEQPGLNIKELAVVMGLSRTPVRHHVRKLIKDGDVVAPRRGNHILHFSSKMPELQRKAVSLLRMGSVRAVVEAVMEDPEVDVQSIAQETGFTARSIRRSIDMLLKEGLAVYSSEGHNPGRILRLHGKMRFAWVLWCKRDDRWEEQGTLWKSPGWLFNFEVVLGYLLGKWSHSD